jgi:DNA-binding MarR family transcriptional regulator
MVRLTTKGSKASEIWPPLFGLVEERWMERFGKEEIGQLQARLQAIAGKLDVELPQGLPGDWEAGGTFAPPAAGGAGLLPLPALLSQVLAAFTIEFNRESRAPLALCANALRVLGEKPIPEADIPRLTGSSPETSGIGWQLKPYIAVEPDPAARRGKVVRLTPPGLSAQQTYRKLTGEIEKRWQERFGAAATRGLRDSLRELFVPRSGDRPLLSEGLVPPPGTARAGDQAPALGRRDVGAAARQRMRDLVAQTEMFLRDPAATLPHYPLWDMNRGFGP